MRKNDIQIINEWLESTSSYIGYEMIRMERTEDQVLMVFQGTKREDCTAIIQQGRVDYVGVGSLRITEYLNGERMGFLRH